MFTLLILAHRGHSTLRHIGAQLLGDRSQYCPVPILTSRAGHESDLLEEFVYDQSHEIDRLRRRGELHVHFTVRKEDMDDYVCALPHSSINALMGQNSCGVLSLPDDQALQLYALFESGTGTADNLYIHFGLPDLLRLERDEVPRLFSDRQAAILTRQRKDARFAALSNKLGELCA